MPIEHFKTKGDEMRNLAYRHMNGIPYTATGATVGGVYHKVQHSKNPSRVKIDNKQREKVARKRGGKK